MCIRDRLNVLGIQERNCSMYWESRSGTAQCFGNPGGTAQCTGNPGAEQLSVLGIQGGQLNVLGIQERNSSMFWESTEETAHLLERRTEKSEANAGSIPEHGMGFPVQVSCQLAQTFLRCSYSPCEQSASISARTLKIPSAG